MLETGEQKRSQFTFPIFYLVKNSENILFFYHHFIWLCGSWNYQRTYVWVLPNQVRFRWKNKIFSGFSLNRKIVKEMVTFFVPQSLRKNQTICMYSQCTFRLYCLFFAKLSKHDLCSFYGLYFSLFCLFKDIYPNCAH